MDLLIQVPGNTAIYAFSVDSTGCGLRHLSGEEWEVLKKNPAYETPYKVTAEELAAIREQAKKTPLGPIAVWNYELPLGGSYDPPVGDVFEAAHRLPDRILEQVGKIGVPSLDYSRLAEAVTPLLEDAVAAAVEAAFENVLSRTSLSVGDSPEDPA